MADPVVVRVRGRPKGQPRPRAFATKIGNRVTARVFDSGTAEGWKGDVARAFEDLVPSDPIAGPVKVSIDFFLPRPKRLMRKKDPDGPIWHSGKPDRDNLEKAVLDALTSLGLWGDDAQVVCGEVRKFYHSKSGVPGAVITIEVLDDTVPEVLIEP